MLLPGIPVGVEKNQMFWVLPAILSDDFDLFSWNSKGVFLTAAGLADYEGLAGKKFPLNEF